MKKITKLFSVLLVIAMLAGIVFCVPFTVNSAVIEDNVVGSGLSLEQLKNKFPQGKYWNHTLNGANNPDTYTSTPCPSNHAYVDTCMHFANASQCCGFAKKLAYDVYGSYPPNWSIGSINNVKAGDIIHYSTSSSWGHWVMVINRSGNTLTFGECNYDNRCGISWNRTSTISQIAAKSPTIYVAPSELKNNNGNNPTGCVDSISGTTGAIKISGWAFDIDDINAQLNIHVYIGGDSGDPNAEGFGWITANTYRPDVNSVYSSGEYHGYDVIVPTIKTGIQNVYVYAINVGGGSNVLIGSGVVNIAPDIDKPIIQRTYLSEITNDSYRVCVVPKDNVGIKNVKVATWTKEDQSDIIWHNCLFNGYETYYIDLNRSDYSSVSNSFYNNHIYVYDYAGNYNSVALNMDYKVNSDTGKTISNGEYRIVTAVDLNKAIDIDCGQSANGTNIQIYSNLNEPNQTFDIEYIDNGLYTIISHSNGKSLDVNGDTYLPGTNVVLSQFHNGYNQQWIIKSESDGYYHIVAHSNGLALDVAGGNNENKTNVQVYSMNDTPAQKWKFRRVIKPEMVNMKDITLNKTNSGINAEVNVTVDGTKLILNKDYKIELKYDVQKKSGLIAVTGIGDYCDTVSSSFKLKIGDVNFDSLIDIVDATEIQKHIVNINELSDEQLAVADVNGDGNINVIDATQIQKYIVNLISELG